MREGNPQCSAEGGWGATKRRAKGDEGAARRRAAGWRVVERGDVGPRKEAAQRPADDERPWHGDGLRRCVYGGDRVLAGGGHARAFGYEPKALEGRAELADNLGERAKCRP